jgi:hypothetical protein
MAAVLHLRRPAGPPRLRLPAATLSGVCMNVHYRFAIAETLATKNQINIAAWATKGAYPEAV